MSEVRKTLPEGWALAEGKDLFSFIRGVTYTRNEATQVPDVGRFGILRAGNLQKGIIIVDDLVYVPNKRVDADQLIRRHDIVVAMSSGSKSVVGKAAVADTDMRDISFGAFCGVIRPLIETTAPWLNLYFQSEGYRQTMSDLSSGININNLKTDHFLSLLIPLPPGREIWRIANRVKKLQARSRRAREALETVPDLLDQFRQSLLSAAFRGDLTKEWRKKNPDVEPASELLKRIHAERRKRWEEAELEKLKAKGLIGERLNEEFSKRRKQYKKPTPVDATGLPELPETWFWAALEEISEWVTDGTHQPPPFTKEGIPFLVISNMVNGTIEWDEIDKWVSPETYEKFTGNYKPKKGDIIYSTVGSYGVAVEIVTDRRFMFQRHIASFRPLSKLLSVTYLTHAFNSGFTKSQADKVARGVAQKTINLSDLRRFLIPLAPLPEQNAIVESLEKIFQRVEGERIALKSSLEYLNTMDRAILSQAFQGKLVPQDPSDEPASVLLEHIREELTALHGIESDQANRLILWMKVE